MQRRKQSEAVLGSHLHFKKKDQTSALNGEWKLMQLGQRHEAKMLLITHIWNYCAQILSTAF